MIGTLIKLMAESIENKNMDTGKDRNSNIPTYSTVKGVYNGQEVKGIYKDNPKRLCLDNEGSIRWGFIENPVVVYDVGNPIEITTANGTTGILPLSNGVDINYGPFSQYKTQREAMPLAEAIAQLCAGIDVSMRETGKAMEPRPQYAAIDLNCFVKVKLTKKGIDHLIKQDQNSAKPEGFRRTAQDILGRMDKDGYTQMALHTFMGEFRNGTGILDELVEMKLLIETRG